jgi:protein-tyrosine phosphatase
MSGFKMAFTSVSGVHGLLHYYVARQVGSGPIHRAEARLRRNPGNFSPMKSGDYEPQKGGTMADAGKNTVLFVCTGNYYRSRFAEHFFNAVALREAIAWRADSRGLALERGVGNVGPMSQTATRTLERLGIALPGPLRLPLSVTEDDLRQADLIVALKEAEHRPLFTERFPAWTARVEFWHVHDLDGATPAEALPQIQEEVLRLVARLKPCTSGKLPARSLYADPCFTFRFADDRLIPRFHLAGVPAGQVVRVCAADPKSLEPGQVLATAVVGDSGWVDLPQAIIVRAGEVFVVFPETAGQGG